ncbi:hypothetical protein ACP70R_031228 [Stipagrostis hirtigluma subsp. patula]
MEQAGKRAVLDMSEEVTEKKGEVTARGGASPEQEEAPVEDIAGHNGGTGLEHDGKEDLGESLPEEQEGVAAAGNAGQAVMNEDHDAPENPPPAIRRTGYRAAIARPEPPTSRRRLPLRSRKQYYPRYLAVGAAAPGGPSALVPVSPGAASSATRPAAGLFAMCNAGHGAKNETMDPTALRSELDATVDKSSSDDGNGSTDVKVARAAAAAASSSYRQPNRGRKHRRPEHFTSDEADAADRAKARRSNDALDRHCTSVVHCPPEQWPDWMRRNIRAANLRDLEGSRTASGGGPEEPDGSATILAVVAILGASLALSLTSFVLFYIAGQMNEPGGPTDKHQNK